jgi:integrating conjugative element protein (TIGR03765 family)
MRPERSARPASSGRWRRLRITLLTVMAVLVSAFGYSWYQVRAEKSAQRAALAHPPTLAHPAHPADIDLQKISASDDTVPAAPYFAALIPGEDQALGENYRFPIQTQLMQPGVLPAEGVPVFNAKWMTQTLAVVGDDAASIEWLRLHLARLHSLRTTVIVVAARTAESFKAIQKAVEGLPIVPDSVPDSGPWLQSRLAAAQVSVYPLFIGTDGKARQHIFSDGFAPSAKGSP